MEYIHSSTENEEADQNSIFPRDCYSPRAIGEKYRQTRKKKEKAGFLIYFRVRLPKS